VDLYEYQARDLFEAHGVPVPPGVVASTPAEAEAAARRGHEQRVADASARIRNRYAEVLERLGR